MSVVNPPAMQSSHGPPKKTNNHTHTQAFKEGGCFHSRTAVGMFDYVRQAVDKGEVGRQACMLRGLSYVYTCVGR